MTTEDPRGARAAGVLRESFAEALAALDLAGLTERALGEPPPAGGALVVIALGKCAATMLAGAARGWPAGRASRVVVARPARSAAVDPRVRAAMAPAAFEEFATGHPVPDAESERAGRAALEAARGAGGRGATVLVLLSGGASAAACAPRAGLTMDDLREAARAMLAAGEPIERVNAARGAMDAVKHGGLARAAGAARVITLAAADVLGPDDLARLAVGSAPTIERGEGAAPAGPREYATVASPALAREALSRALARRGYACAPWPDAGDDVGDVAARCARDALALAPGEARAGVGEPTVRLGARTGRGGRAGRLALMVASAIDGAEGLGFLAGATDGVDGESGHAGAAVTGASARRARAAGTDPAEALARFDDASAHEAAGGAIDVGPTGLNLLDLIAAVRAH